MPEDFDPYLTWLGIRETQRPPNHYRLLGVDLFEPSADVIANAADRQMAHVRTFQAGRHGEHSQRILNELAAARVCLLKPERKAAYDQQLRPTLTPLSPTSQPNARPALVKEFKQPAAEPEIEPSAVPDFAAAASPARRNPANKGPSQAVLAIGATVALLIIGGSVVAWRLSQRPAEVAVTAPGDASPANAVPPEQHTASNDPAPTPVEPPAVHKPEPAQPEVISTLPAPAKKTISIEKPAPVERPAPNGVETTGKPTVDTPPSTTPEVRPEINPPIEKPQPEPTAKPMVASAVPETDVPASASKRPAVPAAEAQASAEKLIKELFKNELASRKPEERIALAKKLFEQARETKDDAAARYVLLSQAREVAAGAGEVELASQAGAALAAEYDVDAVALEVDSLTTAAKPGRLPAQYGGVARSALALLDRLTEQDRYDSAKSLLPAAQTAARASKDASLLREATARARQIDKGAAQFSAVKSSLETLAADPTNAEANLAVGKYRCLVKGQWDEGLKMLSLGSDEELRALAQKDLATPPAAKDQVQTGDAWFAYAEKQDAALRPAPQSRAASWYARALPLLAGLDKTKTERRLKELEEAAARASVKVKDNSKNGLLARFVNKNYKMSFSGKVSGASVIRFAADGQFIQDNQSVGTWTLKGDRIVMAYAKIQYGGVELQVGSGDRLEGKGAHENGDVYAWVAVREN